MLGAPFGAETPDLHIRVRPSLQPSEELQNVAVAVDHRGVALLRLGQGWLQSLVTRRDSPPESSRSGRQQSTLGPSQPVPLRDRGEQGVAKGGLRQRVVQHSLVATLFAPQLGYYGSRQLAGQQLSPLFHRERQRQGIGI